MKLIRMRDLCAQLGIPIRTFQKWAEEDPELTILIKGGRGGRSHWVKLDRLVGRQGISLTEAYLLGSSRWMKAVDLAARAGISRKTVANWCRHRPGFAKRIGRIYYVDLEQFGASPDDVESLFQRSRPGNSGQNEQDTQ